MLNIDLDGDVVARYINDNERDLMFEVSFYVDVLHSNDVTVAITIVEKGEFLSHRHVVHFEGEKTKRKVDVLELESEFKESDYFKNVPDLLKEISVVVNEINSILCYTDKSNIDKVLEAIKLGMAVVYEKKIEKEKFLNLPDPLISGLALLDGSVSKDYIESDWGAYRLGHDIIHLKYYLRKDKDGKYYLEIRHWLKDFSNISQINVIDNIVLMSNTPKWKKELKEFGEKMKKLDDKYNTNFRILTHGAIENILVNKYGLTFSEKQ